MADGIPHWDFQGRIVVITDGESNRARHQVLAFAAAGAIVIPVGPETDLCSERQCIALARRLAREHGRLDVLVVNDSTGAQGPLVELDEEQWDAFIACNLTSSFLAVKHLVPMMVDARYGKVVFTTGPESASGVAGSTALCVTRHAVFGLAKDLACEVGRSQVTVNTVAAAKEADADDPAALAALTHTVMWLGSDAARFVTGSLVHAGRHTAVS